VALVFPRTPRPAARRLLDVAVLPWAVGWIVVGILVAREVRALGELSETVVVAGEALGDAGTASPASRNTSRAGLRSRPPTTVCI